MILDRLTKLSPREKFLFAAGGTCILLALLDGIVLQPVLRLYDKLDLTIQTGEKELLEVNRPAVLTEPTVWEEFESVRLMIGRSTSRAVDIAEMKGEIDRLAKETHVNVQSMKHLEPQSKDSYEEYSVAIEEFECDVKSLTRFLHALSTPRGKMRVATLQISPRKDEKVITGSMRITKIMMTDTPQSPDA